MSPGIVIFSLAQGIHGDVLRRDRGVPGQFQGLASGVATSGQQIGAAVGLAVLVAITNPVSGPSPTPAALAGGLRAAVYTAAVLILASVLVVPALRKKPVAPAAESSTSQAVTVTAEQLSS
jgi:hypothetical protein